MARCRYCGDHYDFRARPKWRVAATLRSLTFTERRGIAWVDHVDPLTCGFYDVERKRCRVYSVRPAACRMFGVVQEMPCEFYPDAVRMSLPARSAIASGLMNTTDETLHKTFGGSTLDADAMKAMVAL